MNKKIIFFVMTFLCLYNTSKAQGLMDSVNTFTHNADSSLQFLNKGNIPNLYDRVFPFAGLNDVKLNGDTLSYAYFKQLYSELERCTYGFTPHPDTFSYQDVHNYVKYAATANILPIFNINATVYYLDSNGLTDNRLADSAGYLIRGTNTASPFLTNFIQCAALGTEGSITANTNYTMQFLSSSILHNTASSVTISSITIASSLSNKIWKLNLTKDNIIAFEKPGKDLLTITTELEGGGKIVTYQPITCLMQSANGLAALCGELFKVDATNGPNNNVGNMITGYQGFYETKPYTGIGEYVVFHRRVDGVCQTNITKPIIISDAWDAGDNREIFNIDNSNNLQWFEYTKKLEDIYHSHLTWTDNDETTGVAHNLVADMQDAGYDVVIADYNEHGVDFVLKWVKPMGPGFIPMNGPGGNNIQIPIPTKIIDGGTDYVQRNAQTFQEILRRINLEVKVVPIGVIPEKCVIVGPSMGGQITRYALRDLEIKGLDHNTRLWVSFDSPHHGSNIPYGIQRTLNYFATKLGSDAAKGFIDDQLKAPAARQFNISQLSENNLEVDTKLAIDNQFPHHVNYYNEINNPAFGMPEKLRKIALVNGSYKGGKYHADGSRAFKLQVWAGKNKNDCYLTNETFFMNTNNHSTIQKTFGGDNIGLNLMGGIMRLIKRVPAMHDWWSVSNVYGSVDAVPGGLYDVQGELYGEMQGKFNIKIGVESWLFNTTFWLLKAGFPDFQYATHDASFIPTYSSLAIVNKDVDWSLPINIGSVLCQQQTPFDNFYAPENNQKHTFLSKDNVAWVLEEIEKGHKGIDCTLDPCVKYTLSGPQELCEGGNYTFNITPALPPNIKVTWGMSEGAFNIGNGLVTTNAGVTSFTGGITPIQDWGQGQQSSKGKLVATINNPCGTNIKLSLNLDAYVNNYSYDNFIFTSSQIWCEYNIGLPYYPDATYTWYDVDPALGGIPITNNSNWSPYGAYPFGSGVHQVWAKINSACFGASQLFYKEFANNYHCREEQSEWELDDAENYDEPAEGWGSNHDVWGDDFPWDDQDQDIDYDGPRLANKKSIIKTISVTPNPSSTSWFIKTNAKSETVLEARILDVTGKEVYRKKYIVSARTKFEIPCNQLTSGVYFIEVLENGKIQTVKVIRQ